MSGGLNDTICAVATAAGEGGVGIVRLSGTDAVEIAGGLAKLRCRKPLASARSHTLYLADLVFRTSPSELKSAEQPIDSPSQAFDEALVVVMRGPRSFTGEDVVEFHCHGSPLIEGM